MNKLDVLYVLCDKLGVYALIVCDLMPILGYEQLDPSLALYSRSGKRNCANGLNSYFRTYAGGNNCTV